MIRSGFLGNSPLDHRGFTLVEVMVAIMSIPIS
ncbi:MAG: prepilin-type N-terminal cleavage/methylation domain-containing protein [Desulfobacter sp.]|nr:prepilin-type N-terminal cleavage/methylation domain-containing protein [Desulfobacter sp.]WDP87113.1 MAG: prepilin-type N-terminal cleavage/methylation domain-containing protein [Desulfobacter sp.]